MSPAAATSGYPFDGSGTTGGTPPPPPGGACLAARTIRRRARGFRFPFRTDFGSFTFSTPFDAAFRTTESLSLSLRFPTVRDALLMSAGAMLFSLNSTVPGFWREGASVRVTASADSPQNAKQMSPATVPTDSRGQKGLRDT